MNSRYLIATLCIAACMSASAQKGKSRNSAELTNAKELFEKKQYDKAAPTLRDLADKEPRNTSLNSMAGIALMRSGHSSQARKYLERGGAEGQLQLSELDFNEYNFEKALERLEEYETAQQKAKKPLSQQHDMLMNRIQNGMSMLDRVEDIAIIDSLCVDKEAFFRYYRLSSPSGRITDTSVLPQGFKSTQGATAYVTENNETMIWSAPDDNGHAQLLQSAKLADNSWETPQPLGESLGMGGNALYPFLMSDGVTLYYASDGEGSIGGYDIFLTRNDGDKYLQPQNVGMPYNSPANDYLLAIDELTGTGWWATDRNAPEGKVNIYVYVPNDIRKNYSVDREDLVSLAKVSSIAATRPAGSNYSELIKRINELGTQDNDSRKDFEFALPSGKICHSMNDIRSSEGRKAMRAYLLYKAELERTLESLEKLRARYAQGDSSVSETILDAEARVLELRDEIRTKSNEIATAENN